MVKLLHVADVHIGVSRHGKVVDGRNSRLDDMGSVLTRFAEVAISEQVDLALIVGDLFDGRRPGPDEIRVAIRPLQALSAAKIRTLITPGNHDGMGTIADPDSHTLGWMAELEMPRVHVFTKPGTGIVLAGDVEVNVARIPFPHKRAYDVEHAELEIAERVELVSRDVEQAIAYMATLMKGPEIRLFMGHLTVAGAMLGQESAMRMGWDVMINPQVLEAFDYAALGHIHRQQEVTAKAWYSGSPAALDWDDEEPKGFLLVDVAKGKTPVVEVVPSGARRLVTIMTDAQDDQLPAGPDVTDAIVRLIVEPLPGERVPSNMIAAITAAVYAEGAFYVKPEVMVSIDPTRRRVQLDPEADVIDALETWAEAKGVDPGKVVPVGRELLASFHGS